MTYQQLWDITQLKMHYIGSWNRSYLTARAHGQIHHDVITVFDIAELKVLRWVLMANVRRRRQEDIKVPVGMDENLFYEMVASLKL